MLLAFPVDINRRNDSVGIEFLNQHGAFRLIPVGELIIRNAIGAVAHKYYDPVVPVEFAEVLSTFVLVQPARSIVIPKVQLAQCRCSRFKEFNPPDGILGNGVTTGAPSLYLKLREIVLEYFLARGARL